MKTATRGVFVLRDGELTEKDGPSVENLREDMRKLPGDYVTKEAADGDRVHIDDEDHVRETIIIDRQAAEAKEEAGGEKADINKEAPNLGESEAHTTIPLNQRRVDNVRFRAVWGLITGAQQLWKEGQLWEHKLEHHHLWFPEDNVNNYELRPGNAPAPNLRPKHMERIELFVDPLNPPESVRWQLEMRGVDTQDLWMTFKTMRESLAQNVPEVEEMQ